ncbi:MAG TPA: glutamine--fructose-6-phosphate transaminase (isomerizing) [Terriglobales bacterium]|nr:glutamine--fructose-6-phosphate transaminase (isomerizing) [Terriglobales bacterium]
MCGIIGYVGPQRCADILLNGLKTLEYRGYDSAGLAFFENGEIQEVKAAGRISNLEKKMEGRLDADTHCGIGHTRWATHGGPTDENAHPHCSEHIALLHNGIIENYLELKEFLLKEGYTFKSQTDTETAAHLIDWCYKQKGDFLDAVIMALGRIKGTYAFGIICKDEPDKIICVRQENPLLIGLGDGENFMASGLPAFIKYTKNYYVMEPGEIAVIEADKVTVLDFDKNPVKKEVLEITWDYAAAERGGYPHFMIKEIHETPSILKATMGPRIRDGIVQFGADELPDDLLKSCKSITVLACGSAMHAGMVAKYVIERMCRVKVDVEVASEFRGRQPILTPDDLVIVISQSGETLDTLGALKLAKSCGSKILSIVNVVASSIARESDHVVYTWTGPEIAVATTKAYSAQVAVGYMLAARMAYVRGLMSLEELKAFTVKLQKMPDLITGILAREEEFKALAASYKDYEDLFFIGRGLDYALALEGSLKLKEISYMHSETYAAGELKHGTISLVTDGVPVISLATQSDLADKMVSNTKEVDARGARVLAVCRESVRNSLYFADDVIALPDFEDILMPSLAVIPLQLLSYHIAVARGCDVDKPRNLAKSVTVE